jgi:hypothetical protein
MTRVRHFTNGMNVWLQFRAGANPRNDRCVPGKRNVFPELEIVALRAFPRPPANSFVAVQLVQRGTRKVPSAWNGSTIAPYLYGVLEFQYLDAVYGVSNHGNHSPVQPKGLYRRRGLEPHRYLPRAPEKRRATPQPGLFAAGGRCGTGGRSRGRAVVLHQLRSRSGHHAPAALPTLTAAHFPASATLTSFFTVICTLFAARLSTRLERLRYFPYCGPRDCPGFHARCAHESGA